MNDPKAMEALMAIKGFRNLNEDLETIITRSEQIKDAKRQIADGEEGSKGSKTEKRLWLPGGFQGGLGDDCRGESRSRYNRANERGELFP